MTVEELKDIKDKMQQSDGYIYLSIKEGRYTSYINEIMAYMSDEDVYTNNPNDLFNYRSISELASMADNDNDLLNVFIKALINLNQ